MSAPPHLTTARNRLSRASAATHDTKRVPREAPIHLHPWSLEYIRLRLSAGLIRSVLGGGMFLAEHIFQRVPKDVQVTKIRIPARADAGSSSSPSSKRTIEAHVYAPKSLGFDINRRHPGGEGNDDKPAVHLNFHGSGFMIPSLGSDREFCSKLAHDLNMVVVDCDYRKAPEWPWPAAPQDVEDCLLWALSRGDAFDVSRVSIGGFSAGANLALVTSGLHGDALSAVVAFYPPCDFTVERGVKKPPPEKHSMAIPLSVARMFDRSYILAAGVDRGDPLISPVKMDPASFPDTVWLCCARGDTLYNDGKKLMEQLKDAGRSKDVEFHDVPGEAHAFDKAARSGTETAKRKDKSYEAAVSAIRRSWGGEALNEPTGRGVGGGESKL